MFQLHAMTNVILPDLLQKHPQLHPYHFMPPELLHPVTSIYELSYGETEMKQVDVRRSLHLRLGLPFDRPLLASALNFSIKKDSSRSMSVKRGTSMLKDVHNGIPSSGVSGGVVFLIQGSYDYYHYLQDGFYDSGWGCAYGSLQTIVSWFKLQTTYLLMFLHTDMKTSELLFREIQQSLVEIGDKDLSFIGSREWIGAIELSFVLDKLLGVEVFWPTPFFGVDYNEASGDCAFLILDPHYTGSDDLKKIVDGGWCGWKKAVDSKGKHFFLHNKFYNLLLPQQPSMV